MKKDVLKKLTTKIIQIATPNRISEKTQEKLLTLK